MAGAGECDSPTARDLISNTDRWHELKYKCAKMERANMRISNIDLTITGDDIQYSFGVDEEEEEDLRAPVHRGSAVHIVAPEDDPETLFVGQILTRDMGHILTRDPHHTQHLSLKRTHSVEPADQGAQCPSSTMVKSRSLASADLERPQQLNDLPAADPAILRYFSVVEDLMMSDGSNDLEGQATTPSEEEDASQRFPFQGGMGDILHGQGTDGFPAAGMGAPLGHSSRMTTPFVPESPLRGGCPTPGRQFPLAAFGQRALLLRSSAASSKVPRPHSPQLFVNVGGEEGSSRGVPSSSHHSRGVSSMEGGCASPSDSLTQGVESPPWRKPQSSRLGGSCNELQPSKILDAGNRSGRKMLRGLFKV